MSRKVAYMRGLEQAIEAGEYVTGEEEVHVDEVLRRSLLTPSFALS